MRSYRTQSQKAYNLLLKRQPHYHVRNFPSSGKPAQMMISRVKFFEKLLCILNWGRFLALKVDMYFYFKTRQLEEGELQGYLGYLCSIFLFMRAASLFDFKLIFRTAHIKKLLQRNNTEKYAYSFLLFNFGNFSMSFASYKNFYLNNLDNFLITNFAPSLSLNFQHFL